MISNATTGVPMALMDTGKSMAILDQLPRRTRAAVKDAAMQIDVASVAERFLSYVDCGSPLDWADTMTALAIADLEVADIEAFALKPGGGAHLAAKATICRYDSGSYVGEALCRTSL